MKDKTEWTQRAITAGEVMANRLLERPRSKGAINAGLKQFKIDLYMAFVDHEAPDPETLTAVAMTTARKRLKLLN